jgi:hypothetical protein
MTILTPAEKEFQDVFLHEATTSPYFSGPATKALYALGVEYRDISYLAWAYEREVPRTSFESGHWPVWHHPSLDDSRGRPAT